MGKALTLHINYGPGAGVKDLDLEWNGDTPDAESLLTILDRVIPWPTASAVAHAVMESFQQEPTPEPNVVEDTRCSRTACRHERRLHQMDRDGWGPCVECADTTKCRSYVERLPGTRVVT